MNSITLAPPGAKLAAIVATAVDRAPPGITRERLCNIPESDKDLIIALYREVTKERNDATAEIAGWPARKRMLLARNAHLKDASTLVGIAEKFDIGRSTVQLILKDVRA